MHYYQSTWNFKEGEKLLWFFWPAKNVEKRMSMETTLLNFTTLWKVCRGGEFS